MQKFADNAILPGCIIVLNAKDIQHRREEGPLFEIQICSLALYIEEAMVLNSKTKPK